MKTTRSEELTSLSEAVIPGGVNSPVRAFKAVGGGPRFIERGSGPYMFDVDGNRYLDFCSSWGPLIFGHADSDIVAAITEQVQRGSTFGAVTEYEFNLAEFVVSHIDAVDKVRFVSSGTEAVMSAVRLARGYTSRDVVVKFDGCYHGHSDYLLVKAGSGLATFSQPSSAGISKGAAGETIVLPLDDDAALEKCFAEQGEKIAAVIIEGIPANNGLLVQRPEFVKLIRSLTEKHGALMILDEVITGFRIGMEGAAGMYGVTPDLLTYGKIVGGGLPVGAFGGRAEIMDKLSPNGPVYQAGTLSGNPLAMVAGLATLNKLADGKVYQRLEENSALFVDALSAKLGDAVFKIARVGSIFWVVFQDEMPRSAAGI
ncbi:glutamate-1-semialdehyde 2,1-aminomutase, partial [bacterium AH-315-J21]|nr:glutamate-1-semialdehyde 2,1-aminomutase [bacterium AH-315-J21]